MIYLLNEKKIISKNKKEIKLSVFTKVTSFTNV